MNPLAKHVVTGTTGELLVQLRLLQYGVQAAAPLKDSGNDLIATRGRTLKAIQVKTTGPSGTWEIPRNRLYDVLALVRLQGEDEELWLDQSHVYLVDRGVIDAGRFTMNELAAHAIGRGIVDCLFPVADAEAVGV